MQTASHHPFHEEPTTPDEDAQLVEQAKSGSREALESLVKRHQAWVYNIAVRMLYHPEDAQDATQEVMVRAVTKLDSFAGKSRFRTWLYRLAVNHLLNIKRGRLEPETMNFSDFGRQLDEAPDAELPDPAGVPVDVQVLVRESLIGCSSAMLLCLDREQRMTYILGEILSVPDSLAAELLGIRPDAFRKRLSRARTDLHSFMNDKCGLVNEKNPCRCARKTRAFIDAGHVNPNNILFAKDRLAQVQDRLPEFCRDLKDVDAAFTKVYREHPYYEPQDFVPRLRKILDGANLGRDRKPN